MLKKQAIINEKLKQCSAVKATRVGNGINVMQRTANSCIFSKGKLTNLSLS